MQKGDILGLVMMTAGVALLAAFFIFADEAPELSYAPVDVGGGSLEVPSGQTSLTEVSVNANLARAGFVTIHRSVGPAPGPVMGTSSLLPEGEQTSIIKINGEMIPGYTYIALLHVDNGDGVFVATDDMPVQVDGTVVRVDFDAAGESILLPTE